MLTESGGPDRYAPEQVDELDRIIAESSIVPVFQPIVEIATREVVAYEALARGPEGSLLERPDQLFPLARATGRLAALDWTCKTRAVAAATEAHMSPPLTLFINAEPDTLGSKMPASFAEHWITAKMSYLHLTFELTERAVAADPAGMLRNVDHLRSFGWSVALDDVGAEPESMAMLPFVRPDVIKLDMSLVDGRRSPQLTEVLMAVNAEAERSGAVVLAEGVETEEHLSRATAAGATFAQGWLFGRPQPLPARLPEGRQRIRLGPVARPSSAAGTTPWDRLVESLTPRRATGADLLSLSRHLEQRARTVPYPAVVIAAFESEERFDERARQTYEDLSTRSPLVAVAAEGIDTAPVGDVRGVPLPSDDPLREQWVVSVISPYWAAMLCGKEVEPSEASLDRQFDMILTFDRDLTIEAAGSIISRLVNATELSDAGSSKEVHMAAELARAIAESDRVEDLARPLLRLMAEMTGLKSTFLSNIHDDTYDVVVSENLADLNVEEGMRLPWSQTVCRTALDLGRDAFLDLQDELPRHEMAKDLGFRTFVTCPIVVEDGKVAGTLCGASDQLTGVTDGQLDMVRSFARLIGSRISDGAASSEVRPASS